MQKDSNTSFEINTHNTPLVYNGHYFFGMPFVKNAEKLNTNEIKKTCDEGMQTRIFPRSRSWTFFWRVRARKQSKSQEILEFWEPGGIFANSQSDYRKH